MSRKTELAEKKRFEIILCKDSIDKTVSQALIDIGKETKIRIEDVKEMGNDLEPLAQYKDGMAFIQVYEDNYDCVQKEYNYILHRNGEDKMYVLEEIIVLHNND